jgi:hypothetical protein
MGHPIILPSSEGISKAALKQYGDLGSSLAKEAITSHPNNVCPLLCSKQSQWTQEGHLPGSYEATSEEAGDHGG